MIRALPALSLVVALAMSGRPAQEAASPEPAGIAAVERLASRAAADLSARTAYRVQPPPVRVGAAASRAAQVGERWRDGYPWLDDDSRDLLAALGLVDRRFNLRSAFGRLVPDEPGATIHGGSIVIPEGLGEGLVADELLEAVGLSSLELRLLAEMARAMALKRLDAAGEAGSAETRAARWCVAQGYARLVVLDVILRAGGVTAQDAGVGLLGLETRPAVLAPDPDLVLALPDSVTDHLTGGPEDGLRFLVARLLAGGWPAVDAALDSPVHGFAALDPSTPAPAPTRPQGPALGPRHLLSALVQRGVPVEDGRILAAALRGDRASRPREGFWTWRLVFATPEDARALAAAWGTAAGPSITVSGAEALLTARTAP